MHEAAFDLVQKLTGREVIGLGNLETDMICLEDECFRNCRYFVQLRLRSIVMSMSVCLFGCLSARVTQTGLQRGRTLQFFVHVACGRGSVLL